MLSRLAFLAVVAGAAIGTIRSDHENWEDVSMICSAGSSSSACEFPVVTARNIDGQNITDKMRLTVTKYTVNDNADSMEPIFACYGPNEKAGCMKDDIPVDFQQTGYYLFNYTAVDETSRSAEDVVFALFIDDLVAPEITAPTSLEVEACNPAYDAHFPTACQPADLTGWSARDEVDGDVSDTLRFSSMNFENKDKQLTNWLALCWSGKLIVSSRVMRPPRSSAMITSVSVRPSFVVRVSMSMSRIVANANILGPLAPWMMSDFFAVST